MEVQHTAANFAAALSGNSEDHPLFDAYCEWRTFEDDADSEPACTAWLDRRASFDQWLDILQRNAADERVKQLLREGAL